MPASIRPDALVFSAAQMLHQALARKQFHRFQLLPVGAPGEHFLMLLVPGNQASATAVPGSRYVPKPHPGIQQ